MLEIDLILNLEPQEIQTKQNTRLLIKLTRVNQYRRQLNLFLTSMGKFDIS